MSLIRGRATGGSGSTGPAGESAYQLWLDAGNSGTLTDFLTSLVGPSGPAGPAGPTGSGGSGGLLMREASVVGARPLMDYGYLSASAWGSGGTPTDPAEAANTWIRVPLPAGVAGSPGVLRFINWGTQANFDQANIPGGVNEPDPMSLACAIKTQTQVQASNQSNPANAAWPLFWEDGAEYATLAARGDRITKPFRLGDPGDTYMQLRTFAQNAATSPLRGFVLGGPIPGSGNGSYSGDFVSHSLGEGDKRFTMSNTLAAGAGFGFGVWPFAVYALEMPSGLAYLPTAVVGDSRVSGQTGWLAMVLGNYSGAGRVPFVNLARATEAGSQFSTRPYAFLRWGMLRGVKAAVLTYGINDLSSATQVPLSTIQNMRTGICSMLKQAGVTTVVETTISPATARIDTSGAWTPDNQTSTSGHPRAASEPTRLAFNSWLRTNADPTTHIFDSTGGQTRYLFDECAVVATTNTAGQEVWAAPGGTPNTADGLHATASGNTLLATAANTQLLPFLVRT